MLDYIVSNTWSFMTVFFVVALIPSVVIIKRPFKNLILGRATQFIVSALAFCALMYLIMGPNGYAGHFIGALSNGEKICLVEEHFQGDGDGGSWEEHRLYILDVKDGHRILRMNIEASSILCMTSNSVILPAPGGTAIEYNLETGKKMREWNTEKGFEKFPELSVGIQDMNYSSEYYEHINEAWLTLKAKNGYHYCYNLLTEELIQAEYPPRRDFKNSFDEYGVELRVTDYYHAYRYSLETKNGEIEQLVYRNLQSDTVMYPGEFLDPKIVCLDTVQQFFVVLHYETLDRTNAFLTAINYDLKTRWAISQRDLQVADYYTKTPEISNVFMNGENIFASFGGTVVCLRANDGNLVWKQTQ